MYRGDSIQGKPTSASYKGSLSSSPGARIGTCLALADSIHDAWFPCRSLVAADFGYGTKPKLSETPKHRNSIFSKLHLPLVERGRGRPVLVVFTQKKNGNFRKKIEKLANRQLIAGIMGLGYRSYLSTGFAMDDFVTREAGNELASPAATSGDPWASAKKTHDEKQKEYWECDYCKNIPAVTQREWACPWQY